MRTNVNKIFVDFAKIFLFIGLMVLVALLLNHLIVALPFSKYTNRLILESITVILVILFYYLFRVKWDKVSLPKLNISPNRQRLILLGYGGLIGTALLMTVFFILKSLSTISISKLGNINMDRISIIFITMLFAAIWEETAFRGYMLQKLAETVGVHQSCIVVALCFGLLHLLSPLFGLQIVTSAFMSGMLLNYAYFYAGNLYLPIGIHFGWNFLNSLFFSGRLYHVEYLNNTLAGIKNPEQGVVAIVITGLSAVCLVVLYICKVRRNSGDMLI